MTSPVASCKHLQKAKFSNSTNYGYFLPFRLLVAHIDRIFKELCIASEHASMMEFLFNETSNYDHVGQR